MRRRRAAGGGFMTVARVCGMLSANQGMGGQSMGGITRRLSEFVAATSYEYYRWRKGEGDPDQ